MKKFFMLMASLLVLGAVGMGFVSCSDDDDEEDTLEITFKKSTDTFEIDGSKYTGVFVSEETDLDGEKWKFFLYVSATQITDNVATGSWMFGFVNNDTEIPYLPLYKGAFLESNDKDILNRTHYYDWNTQEWKEAKKTGWKTINTSGSSFKITLTEEDGKELEKYFPN